MAQKIENVQKKISLGRKTPTTHPVISVFLFTFGLLWLVALLDYVPHQSIYVTTSPLPNKIGWLGAMLSFWSLYVTGALAWALPFLCFFIAYKFFFRQLYPLNRWKWIACILSMVMTCALMTSYQHAWGSRSSWSSNYFSYGWGGLVGDFTFSKGLSPMFGLLGSFLFLVPLDLLALILLLCPPNHPKGVVEWLGAKGSWIKEKWKRYCLELQHTRAAKALEASRKALVHPEKKTLVQPGKPAKAPLDQAQGVEMPHLNTAPKAPASLEKEELSLRAILQQTHTLPTSLPFPAEISPAKIELFDPTLPTPKLPHASLRLDQGLQSPAPSSVDLSEQPEGPDLAVSLASSQQTSPEGVSPAVAACLPERIDPVDQQNKQKVPPILSSSLDTQAMARSAQAMGHGKTPPNLLGQQTIRIIAEEKVEKALLTPHSRGNYQFPPIDLLAEPAAQHTTALEDHQSTMDSLVVTLKQFGIEVAPSEVYAGPVITRYEVVPAPGVRVEKIANLEKNIAMALRALSVRIIAPVPGKGCVGIEIPNARPEPVCLREIIESRSWAEAQAEIPLVLGKEVTGKPLVVDLVKMPHLLIAGATGAGKTVCINAIIASLVYHGSPADIRFLMVDPKIVEMQMYNSLPHMLIPVVTDPKKVPNALKWLISEMEKRYRIFAKVGVRNIAGFNAKVLKDKEEREKAKALDAALSPEERAALSSIDTDTIVDIPQQKMPYIVCIIDELADLMMVAPADIETCIARLAQLARAAGIHLIIATQRPSVNVITGVIKANLPSRIAFKVPSKVDSRTILDGNGADTLIGRGDMLLIPPGSSSPLRAQGAYVSDEEIQGIVDYLKVNGPPVFESSIQETLEDMEEGEDASSDGEWDDAIIPKALEVIRNAKKPSASLLQRRLRIGYNRAARIMDLLEDQGYLKREQQSLPDSEENGD